MTDNGTCYIIRSLLLEPHPGASDTGRRRAPPMRHQLTPGDHLVARGDRARVGTLYPSHREGSRVKHNPYGRVCTQARVVSPHASPKNQLYRTKRSKCRLARRLQRARPPAPDAWSTPKVLEVRLRYLEPGGVPQRCPASPGHPRCATHATPAATPQRGHGHACVAGQSQGKAAWPADVPALYRW
jgi:hypothetical protein